ncbi:hypothetical protein LPJ75_000938 [Coemansia sp. RSA 2598]|nr:hypothetical protein LPJ75_000938 [Coemansia sp. RSA 2598]
MSSDERQPQQQNIPEHLKLAAQWASSSINHAQTTVLSATQHRINQVAEKTERQQEILDGIERQCLAIEATRQAEISGIGEMVGRSCAQIERLGVLVDAVEKNLGEMELAMDKAEGAVGLSIGGRLEQLAKLLGSSVGAGTAPGVPYLRQWASKEEAVPKVINTKEYLN